MDTSRESIRSRADRLPNALEKLCNGLAKPPERGNAQWNRANLGSPSTARSVTSHTASYAAAAKSSRDAAKTVTVPIFKWGQ